MKRIYKALLGFMLMLLASANSFSQDNSPIQFGADLMSRYIWRGVDLGGESPNIQPGLKVLLNSKDTIHSFSIGAWGAYNFNTVNQEADLYITYTFRNIFSFTLSDYYFPGSPTYTVSQKKYFRYKNDNTGHVIEPMISFNGTESIPFTLLFAMNVYGADSRKVNTDGTLGDIFMSKYVEVGYKNSIKGVDYNAFVGAAIDDPDEEKGEVGYYGGNKSAGIVNLGVKASKKIKITNDYSLPVQASLISNPEAEKIYIVFGISF